DLSRPRDLRSARHRLRRLLAATRGADLSREAACAAVVALDRSHACRAGFEPLDVRALHDLRRAIDAVEVEQTIVHALQWFFVIECAVGDRAVLGRSERVVWLHA